MKRSRPGLFLVLGVLPAFGQSVPGRILVRSNHSLEDKAEEALLNSHGAVIEKEISAIEVRVLKVPEAARAGITRALEESGRFEFVEPDYIARAADVIPNDPLYSSAWHLPKISAPAAWSISQGSTSVPIAILDSGVDPTHPDLAAKLLPGYNAVKNSSDTHDIGCSSGHGTAVAGAAAAIGNNGLGVAGVAWLNPIIPIMTDTFLPGSTTECQSFYSDLASGITWATDHGAKVINISGAGSNSSSTLQSAIDYAWSKGTILVASAGNGGVSTLMYPAACNHAVAVGATLANDTLATWSQWGSWITLVAPGYNIYTTMLGGKYGAWWGTSFSAPIVAGALALAWSVAPGLTPSQVVTALEQSTDDLGAVGFDNKFGWGRLNVGKLLNALHPPAPVPCSALVDSASATCKAAIQ